MSWLKGLKKVGGGLAKLASFAPGPVGLAGSALSAGLNGRPVLKSVGSDLTRNSKGAAALLPLAMTGGAAGGLMAGAGGAAGAAGGAAAGGGFMSQLGGLSGVMDLGLGALSGYQGYKAQKKGDKLNQQALDLAMARDAELAPMRQAGIQRLMNAQRPDLSSDYASSNPFARPLRRIG